MKKIFLYLLASRIAILFLPLIIWNLSGKFDFLLTNSFEYWLRWDAPHFIYIAQYGYTNVGDPANYIVFPPLYPIFIKIFGSIFGNFNFWAVTISMVLFSVSGCLFYKLVKEIWDKNIAKKSLFLLAIFPTSYFFTAPYTEALFWVFAMLTLLMSKRKRFFLAGVFAGLAILSRLPGILLIIVPLFIVLQNKKKLSNFTLFILPVGFCVCAYLLINWQLFGDPFAFQNILQNHWQKTFAWPWESIRSSWVVTKAGFDDQYALQVGFWEAIPATFAVIFIPLVWKFLKNTAWSTWYTLSVILITSTSFLLSTPRYLLTIPPLFVFFAILGKKYPVMYYSWIFVSAGLLTYFSMRFVTGEWSF